MLKRDKNRLLLAIREAGFSPESFQAQEVKFGEFEGFQIQYRNTDFRFCVRVSLESYDEFDCSYTKLAPKKPMSDWVPERSFGRIEDVLSNLSYWLEKHLKVFVDEQTIPDLWIEARAQAEFIGGAVSGTDSESFTEPEKEQIRLSIDHVRLLIRETFAPSETEARIVNDRLDYLASAVDRLGKFDWRGVLLSTMVGVATNLSLDTARGAQLLQLFKKAFAGVVHLLT